MLGVDGALWVLARHRLAGLAFKDACPKHRQLDILMLYLIALCVSELQWKLDYKSH